MKLNTNSKIKNILWIVFAVVLVVVASVWLLASFRPDHIEDTK